MQSAHSFSIYTYYTLSSDPPPNSNVPAQQQQGDAAILKPDHGTNFLPGSEQAPDHMAPQPLDHFKRGYKERSHLRDREQSNHDDFGPSNPHAKNHGQQQHGQNNHQMHRRHADNNNDFRNNNTNFDAIRLVDTLCRPGCNVTAALDDSNATGKALTAILSNLARRRKLGVALSVWQWMDQRKIEKNVFHYNALISVCEKMKDNQRALRLLTEMEQNGIPKNEVT